MFTILKDQGIDDYKITILICAFLWFLPFNSIIAHVSEEYAASAAIVSFASHEELHTKHKLFEFYANKKDPNGLYIDQQKANDSSGIDYLNGKYEIEAFDVQYKVLDEYFKKNK